MSSGVGLSRMMQGAVQGIDAGMERRDRDTARERSETQWQQGQADRDYALRRRDIETSRADEQYSIQKGDQDRKRAGSEALRLWMTTGDVEPINKYLNDFTAEGVDHKVEKNPDGTYTGSMSYKGNTKSKIITEDDIGEYMMRVMSQDPYANLKEGVDLKRSSEAKAAEREFDLKKMEREYELKAGLERTKAGLDGEAGGKVPEYMKQLSSISEKHYTRLSETGLMAAFDKSDKARMKDAHFAIARMHYLTGNPDIASAAKAASDTMRKIELGAKDIADAELNSGKLEKDEYDGRVADIMSDMADKMITQAAPKPKDVAGGGGSAPALSREGGEQPAAGGQAPAQQGAAQGTSAPSWDSYLSRAREIGRKRGMSDEAIERDARAHYDSKYGNPDTQQAPAEPPAQGEAPAAQELNRPTKEEEQPVKRDQGPSDAEALTRRRDEERAKAGDQGTTQKKEDEVNPRKDFDRSHQKLLKSLETPNMEQRKKNAMAVIQKFKGKRGPDYMQQLTVKQRKKADALLRKANAVIKASRAQGPDVVRGQEAADEINLSRRGQ